MSSVKQCEPEVHTRKIESGVQFIFMLSKAQLSQNYVNTRICKDELKYMDIKKVLCSLPYSHPKIICFPRNLSSSPI